MFFFFPKNQRNSSGFTLIEMIVVITVVMIIGVLAVSTYAGSRRQARLDIAADAFVSALREQFGKAKNGQLLPFGQSAPQNDLKPACFGVALTTKSLEPLSLQAFPYVALSQNGQADLCDPLQMQKFPYQSFEELEVKEILVNDEQKYDQLKIFYKPPFAKIVVFDQGGVLENVRKIKVTFGSKNTDQNPTKRCVQINTQNNLITRLQESAC